jgi:hypothetical protein
MKAIGDLRDLSRWQTALTVLSLEQALPFWQAMRLDVENPSCVREAAQTAMERLWSSDRSQDAVGRLVREFLVEVSQRSGEATRQLIVGWTDGPFALAYESRAGAQAALWWPLLNALSGLRPGRAVRPLEIDVQKKSALLGNLRKVLSGAVGASDLEAQTPSAWDREVQNEYKDGSPTDWVGTVSRFVSTQRALNAIVECLDLAEMRIFMVWAEQQAPLHGMEADLLEEPRAVSL